MKTYIVTLTINYDIDVFDDQDPRTHWLADEIADIVMARDNGSVVAAYERREAS